MPEDSLLVRTVLAALYLRGAPRSVAPLRARWAAVASAVARDARRLEDAPDVLMARGLRLEAVGLGDAALLEWSLDRLRDGRVVTAACPAYPRRWLQVLGDSTPPALWVDGELPGEEASLAVVGSREVERHVYEFASAVGRQAARLGRVLVSGGAAGCDSAAALGAGAAGGRVLEILPCGLARRSGGRPGTVVSVCAPDEGFSTASAMERNTLIYASASHAVVVAARLKEGGTWHGALDAHRRRLTRLVARRDDGDPAMRALVSVGAVPLAAPSSLEAALASSGPQPALLVA